MNRSYRQPDAEVETDVEIVTLTREDFNELMGFAVRGAKNTIEAYDVKELLGLFQRYLGRMFSESRRSMLEGIRLSSQMELASAREGDSIADLEQFRLWLAFAETNLNKKW